MNRMPRAERAKRMAPAALREVHKKPNTAFAAEIARALYSSNADFSVTEIATSAALRLLENRGLLTSKSVNNPKPRANSQIRLYILTELGRSWLCSTDDKIVELLSS